MLGEAAVPAGAGDMRVLSGGGMAGGLKFLWCCRASLPSGWALAPCLLGGCPVEAEKARCSSPVSNEFLAGHQQEEAPCFRRCMHDVPSRDPSRRDMLLRVGEAPPRLFQPLAVPSCVHSRLGRRRLLVGCAVLIVFVVVAPVVAVVCVLLSLDPFLGLCTVDVGLERHGLGGERVLRVVAVAGPWSVFPRWHRRNSSGELTGATEKHLVGSDRGQT